jgi:predicted ATP-dependent endonuclease of OLD family
MKLVVKNLGAIKKKSEIDLTKRFYTFVGYNNSGKTYVAQSIWYFLTYHTQFKNLDFILDLLEDGFKDNYTINLTNYTTKFNSVYLEKLKTQLGLVDLDVQIKATLDNQLIHRYLVISDENTDTEKSLVYEYYSFIQTANSDILTITRHLLENPITLLEFFKLIPLIPTTRGMLFIPYPINSNHFNSSFYNLVFSFIINQQDIFSNRLLFLPATRTFLPSYYKYLSKGYEQERKEIGEIVRKNPTDTDKIKFLTKKRHTSAVDSVLDKLSSLSSKSEIKPYYADLVADLEKLMQGSIGVENVEGIANSEFGFKVASDTDKKTTLEMYQTSTSVNQLTLLYLYLKYWTEESNNFLIIDEPEENLHPENQIKLLDILVKFANRNNNRVLFTTHSPLMAEAVNNHAHITLLRERGEDVEKIIKDHNLTISPNNSETDTLKHSDYATYFFNGEAIKEYPMTDFGVFFRDFKEAEDKVRTTANTLKEYIYNSQHKKENGEKLSE